MPPEFAGCARRRVRQQLGATHDVALSGLPCKMRCWRISVVALVSVLMYAAKPTRIQVFGGPERGRPSTTGNRTDGLGGSDNCDRKTIPRTANTTSSFQYSSSKPTPDPAKVFLSGYRQTVLAEALYPGVEKMCYTRHAQPSKGDVLIVGMHGPPQNCDGVVSSFPGSVLFYNGEPDGRLSAAERARGNYYYLGPLALGKETNHEMRAVHVAITSILAFVASHGIENLIASNILHCNDGKNFMAYAQTKCETHRERAFAQIADARQHAGQQLPTAIGKCYGKRPKTKFRGRTKRTTSLFSSPGHTSNAETFRHYRFVLAMENSGAVGYISEKMFIAFMSGAIPVYYGTSEIFDVFNREAFIFWDVDDPRPALQQILYLDSNRTAYTEMQARPYLADGAATVLKYFSFTVDNVDGAAKQRVREMLLGRRDIESKYRHV